MHRIGSAFNIIIFFGFILFALGVFLYIINLLSGLGLSPEIFVVAVGALLIIFGVTGARIFSSLQLTQ